MCLTSVDFSLHARVCPNRDHIHVHYVCTEYTTIQTRFYGPRGFYALGVDVPSSSLKGTRRAFVSLVFMIVRCEHMNATTRRARAFGIL